MEQAHCGRDSFSRSSTVLCNLEIGSNITCIYIQFLIVACKHKITLNIYKPPPHETYLAGDQVLRNYLERKEYMFQIIISFDNYQSNSELVPFRVFGD